jgi:hypothetical protein
MKNQRYYQTDRTPFKSIRGKNAIKIKLQKVTTIYIATEEGESTDTIQRETKYPLPSQENRKSESFYDNSFRTSQDKNQQQRNL